MSGFRKSSAGFGICLLLVVAAVLDSGTAAASSEPANNSTIIGLIHSAAGPIPEAELTIYDTLSTVFANIEADDSGQFSVSLPAGEYYLSAEAPGYIKRFFPDAYLAENRSRLAVYPQQILNLNLELERGGSISGRISSEETAAIEFLISALKVDVPYIGWRKDEYVSIAGSGTYIIHGLLPGHYKVFVRGAGFLTEFYPDVLSFDAAGVIQVSAGMVSYGIDFSLVRPGSGLLRGQIIDSGSGAPLGNVNLMAYQWDPDGEDPCKAFTISDNNGNYEFSLTAGTYHVMASIYDDASPDEFYRIYYDRRYSPQLADMVRVYPGMVTDGINLVVNSAANHRLEISGGLTDRTGQHGINGATITAVDVFSGHAVSQTKTTPGGDFTIRNLNSGHYILEISGSGLIPIYWPQALSWQSAEVLDIAGSNVELYNGGAITQDYGTPGLLIAGKVVGPDGPLSGARVYAVSISSDLISYAMTDQNGNYAIASGLTEGAYRLFADLYGYVGAYYNGIIVLDLLQSPRHENIDITLHPALHSVPNDAMDKPEAIRLAGNYPNPFNSSTSIMIVAEREIAAELSVYDISGRKVKSLKSRLKAGLNEILWNGEDDSGEPVATGVYFYKVSGDKTAKSMLLLK